MRHSSLTLAAVAAVSIATAQQARAGDAIQASWDALESLVGDWEGRYSDGTPASVSYRLVSNGTALLETLGTAHDEQMVTVYHRDGSSLLLTHYCSAGNQTRMRSRGLEAGRLSFAYLDASNLSSPDEERMSGLVLGFPGPGRLVHEWTSQAGARQTTGRFEFTRKR